HAPGVPGGVPGYGPPSEPQGSDHPQSVRGRHAHRAHHRRSGVAALAAGDSTRTGAGIAWPFRDAAPITDFGEGEEKGQDIMKKFLAIYTGTAKALAQWRELDEAQRREREAAGMKAW